jgi:FlaA1/EpsC-like NDP-sugar epimerase
MFLGRIAEQRRLWLSRLLTKQVQFGLDLSVLVSAFVLAYLLRFDFAIPWDVSSKMVAQLVYVVPIQFATLFLLGVYSFIWRYIGMAETKAFVKAAVLSCFPTLLLRLGLPGQLHQFRVPLSVVFFDTVLAFAGVMGLRVLRRALYERSLKVRHVGTSIRRDKKPVLLIGAGRAGMLAAREILAIGDSDLLIKGFVDDDPHKQGAVLHGIKVLGTTEDLPELVRRYEIDHVVISIAKASRREFRRILDICERIPVKVRVIPGIFEIVQGKVKVSRIRDLQIEDLLGREPVELDEEEMERFLVGKTVMVTGAGGSIGSELARQVARFQPSALLLVERAEFALFDIDRELRASRPDLPIKPFVADISDGSRMRSIFSAYRPQIVLHAAAHKHVPMMESNASEAVKNNILATRLIGELAGEFEADVFVLISTDKAVRPTSVMGASKRVAELVVQMLNRRFATHYVAVRFGNVIGSAGSVIPIFRQQILRGGPVTVTHPDMTRYFMTIPEAAQLVIQAGTIGRGGEIFILDMGEPVRILDLAKEAITLSGLKPFEEMEIVFTGVRPGEKLYEELDMSEEELSKTRHPKIFIGRLSGYPETRVRYAVERLQYLANHGKERDLRMFFNEFLPEAQVDVDRFEPMLPAAEAAHAPAAVNFR